MTAANAKSTAPTERTLHAALALSKISRGLKNTKFTLALSLERLSALSAIQKHEPITISRLSEVENVSIGTMSRTVASLESDALVRRASDGNDGRAVLVRSTAKGRNAFRRGIQQSLSQIHTLLHGLDADMLDALADFLANVRKLANKSRI
jgi:DNA-binding MarR family transcriptional regulator